jgi:hypothetical protein
VLLAEDDGGQPVAFTNPVIHWTQATQLTRVVHDCVPVNLDAVESRGRDSE